MDPSPEFQGASVLAIGSFNPPIFHPLWLAKNNLIRDEEAASASIQVIHNEVAQFSSDWFSVLVTKDRFVIETKDPTKNLPLRDLALGTFSILEHTPVRSFIFTRLQHFALGSETIWHRVGDFFVPKDFWTTLFPSAGMRSLLIQDSRTPKVSEYTQVRLEPSLNVEFGLFIQVSRHRDPVQMEGGIPKDRMDEFLNELRSSWDDFIMYSTSVAKAVLEASIKAPE